MGKTERAPITEARPCSNARLELELPSCLTRLDVLLRQTTPFLFLLQCYHLLARITRHPRLVCICVTNGQSPPQNLHQRVTSRLIA
jgi:hypothetical protein